MARERINDRYFAWLCDLVSEDNSRYGYHILLQHLFDADFVAILALDENRAGDGINLRYRFGRENGYSDAEVSNYLDNSACSILEMMIALALRCEEHIMEDCNMGNRTARWFWDMIANLGLDRMTDKNFDEEVVDDILHRFINRQYERSGAGGLTTIRDHNIDMRDVDIWYQMMWHLDDVLEREN